MDRSHHELLNDWPSDSPTVLCLRHSPRQFHGLLIPPRHFFIDFVLSTERRLVSCDRTVEVARLPRSDPQEEPPPALPKNTLR